jgi:hypothetical protein
MKAMAKKQEKGDSRYRLPDNNEEIIDRQSEVWAAETARKNAQENVDKSFPKPDNWLDREARLEEEALTMSEEELDEVVRDYPGRTPIDYKEIGVENFFDGHFDNEPSEYAKFFELKLCVYDREPFIRLALVESISEGEDEVEFRLRFIPAGKLPTSKESKITVTAPKSGLQKVMEGTRVGCKNMYFSPVTIGKVLDGWHEK